MAIQFKCKPRTMAELKKDHLEAIVVIELATGLCFDHRVIGLEIEIRNVEALAIANPGSTLGHLANLWLASKQR